jgi:hypothetical protein
LTAEVFTITAGQSRWWNFHINRPARVVGRFSVERYDVMVSLVDESGNEHYSSGRAQADSLNVPLLPGTYKLVFDNSYALFHSKTVTSHFEIMPQ